MFYSNLRLFPLFLEWRFQAFHNVSLLRSLLKCLLVCGITHSYKKVLFRADVLLELQIISSGPLDFDFTGFDPKTHGNLILQKPFLHFRARLNCDVEQNYSCQVVDHS